MWILWRVMIANMVIFFPAIAVSVDINSYKARCNFNTKETSILSPIDVSLSDILQVHEIYTQLKKVQENVILIQKTNVITPRKDCDLQAASKKISENNKQASAIATIVKYGGIVSFMPLNEDGGTVVAIAACGGQGWHGHWEALQELKNIRNLQIVILEDEELPTEATAYIEGIKTLTCLRICSSKLKDKAIENLTKHKCLTQLELDCPLITEKGLMHLRKIPSLSSLNLLRPDNVTHYEMDACLGDIKGLKCIYHDYSKTKNIKTEEENKRKIKGFAPRSLAEGED